MRYHTAADNQLPAKAPREGGEEGKGHAICLSQSFVSSKSDCQSAWQDLSTNPGHPLFEFFAFPLSEPHTSAYSRRSNMALYFFFGGKATTGFFVPSLDGYAIMMKLVDFGLACSLLVAGDTVRPQPQ